MFGMMHRIILVVIARCRIIRVYIGKGAETMMFLFGEPPKAISSDCVARRFTAGNTIAFDEMTSGILGMESYEQATNRTSYIEETGATETHACCQEQFGKQDYNIQQ